MEVERQTTPIIDDMASAKEASALNALLGQTSEEIPTSAPEDWVSSKQLIDELRCTHKVLNRVVRELQEEFPDEPEWFGVFKSNSGNKNYGRVIPHFHPEAAELIRQKVPPEESAPEGWMSRNALSNQFRIDNKLSQKWIGETIDEHPEWFSITMARNGNSITSVSPDFVNF